MGQTRLRSYLLTHHSPRTLTLAYNYTLPSQPILTAYETFPPVHTEFSPIQISGSDIVSSVVGVASEELSSIQQLHSSINKRLAVL
eukprot:gene1449-4611_t